MGYFNLRDLVGTEIVENEAINTGLSGNVYKKIKWTVIEAYPHFVKAMRIADDGREFYTTFNIGTLVTMGIIEQKGRGKYYG